MRKELREKIIAYNRTLQEKGEKASDMDIIIAAFAQLPPGQLKKVMTDDVINVFAKYGVVID